MADVTAGATGIRAADQKPRRSALSTIRRVIPYLWPAGEGWVKRRVVLALVALFAAKVFSLITPFFYKAAVDSLAGEARDDGWLMALGAIGLTVAYGVARLSNIGFGNCATRSSCAWASARCASSRSRPSRISTRCRCASTSPARRAACRGSSSAA